MFLLFLFLLFMSYGQNIATSYTGYRGNIYHTCGNVGNRDKLYPFRIYLCCKKGNNHQKFFNYIPIDSLQDYIASNNHLPNIPNTNRIKEEGYALESMDALLLKKS